MPPAPGSERAGDAVPGRRPRRWRLGALAVAVAACCYVAVTFVQVVRASTRDEARPADAIVVLGAAQYDGRPSPVLEARLAHALALWQQGLAPLVVVTGGKQPGDRFTEAAAAAGWLTRRGVPDEQVLREVQGSNSWESLAAAARILRDRAAERVVLVSDGFHAMRIKGIASEVGLEAYVSPVPDSPIAGAARLRALGRETGAVALGRIVGYRRLLRLT